MTDRKKVIRGLECCNAPNNHDECPYNGEAHYNICTHKLLKDATELLKRQDETRKVNIIAKLNNFISTGVCPTCGKTLNTNCNKRFCGECGTGLNWDDQ